MDKLSSEIKMTKIVIVGAGFGGLQAALGLEKKYKNNKNFSTTLIDKRDYHLFAPNLFEVATAEEELVSVKQLKSSIALPIRKILHGKNIRFLQGQVNSVEAQRNRLAMDGKIIEYDFLVLALGSQSDFFNIPGAEANALTLKDLPDALRIRNAVEFAIQAHRMDVNKNTLRVVVAGGGYTGVELVGELKGLLDFLAWKNQYPREKIELEIIEAANKLVPGFDNRLSQDVYDRLRDLDVRVRLSARIATVDSHLLELMGGEKIAHDVLIWTTGVKACGMDMGSSLALDKKGRLPVNGFFQIDGHHNVFALGDIACVLDPSGKPVPSSAQDACDQGKYLAKALPYIMKNQTPPKAYVPDKHGFIVNVGGKWAVMSYKGFYCKGFLAFVIDSLAHLNYYISIVGVYKAIKWLVFQVEMYNRND